MSPVPPLPPLSFAVLLGIIQGVTEFLPISSSGHLAAAQLLFPAFSHPGVTLEVVTHVGTAVAVLAYYRRLVAALLGFEPTDSEEDPLLGLSRVRWAVLIFIGTLPTALVGWLFRGAIRDAFHELAWIAAGLAVTGGVLMASRLRQREGGPIDWRSALVVGLVQGVAIFPGVSRSGLTITAALLLGVRKTQAVTFSFFLAIPAILGAALLDVVQMAGEPSGLALLSIRLLFASLAAGSVGYFCIGLVHRATETGWWHRFAWYCWLAALVLIVAGR